MFIKKIAYGSKNFPWSYSRFSKEIKYGKGTCPVAEDLLDKSYLGLAMFAFDWKISDINLIIRAFKKVWNNLDKLK